MEDFDLIPIDRDTVISNLTTFLLPSVKRLLGVKTRLHKAYLDNKDNTFMGFKRT